jgi:hypothetical protein
MLTAILLAAAAAFIGRDWLLERVRQLAESDAAKAIGWRQVAVAGLLVAAGVSYWGSLPRDAEPTPAPPDPAAFSLRGAFVGPDASADAATTSALLDELASEIEWDGMQPEPLIRTGVAIDDVRVRARELRCRGVSLGEKHPRARAAIKDYLDREAGTSGGPLTPQSRAAWVTAFREVARAAANASR